MEKEFVNIYGEGRTDVKKGMGVGSNIKKERSFNKTLAHTG